MPPSSSLLSRYPALGRAARVLDGPPPCKARSHDLFDLGCELSRMARRSVARQDQVPHTPMQPPDAERLVDYDAKDRRGVAGD